MQLCVNWRQTLALEESSGSLRRPRRHTWDAPRPHLCVKFRQPRSADDRNDRNKPGRPQVKQIIWLTNRSINKTLINEFPNSSVFIDISSAWSLVLTLSVFVVWCNIFHLFQDCFVAFFVGCFMSVNPVPLSGPWAPGSENPCAYWMKSKVTEFPGRDKSKSEKSLNFSILSPWRQAGNQVLGPSDYNFCGF